ncbi:MAG TPA: hypothetical protein DDZ80_08140 [Cyanobacteria bacterium UBA8803]|nr:hypothetical protein [Cyanobacteria bacterium UBA8803]
MVFSCSSFCSSICCWLLVVCCWLFVVGCWLLVVCCWLFVVGCLLLVVGCSGILCDEQLTTNNELSYRPCFWV